MRSTAVVADPAGAQPSTGGTAEGHQQQVVHKEPPHQDEGDEDPWSDDEEEYERLVANSKEGETVEKVKIRESAKIAKKNKVGEGSKKTK